MTSSPSPLVVIDDVRPETAPARPRPRQDGGVPW
ncbi:hypothetical protein FHR81_000578 [Actinoalloteichus hoggarensis]|nr:hypothetical protein [Actinoalloteichus hoggarensis]